MNQKKGEVVVNHETDEHLIFTAYLDDGRSFSVTIEKDRMKKGSSCNANVLELD